MTLTETYLLLGSNLGDRELFLSEAKRRIQKDIGEISSASSIYESEPWGMNNKNLFLNQVLLVKTILSAKEVLVNILNIEKQLGRRRSQGHYSSRCIDIDILFWGNHVVEDDLLTLPHPRIQERRFVLTPLFELNPELVHPVLQSNIESLLAACSDNLMVRKFTS
jgi:2-amino-4-hydroxy-6-hydroxymethyldihydropteridine diphosphokinase